ncbi:hypothetical protein [Flavobacterium sp. PL002]|uniref:hypothetical protein n=1 Tax=Flavobacterium sp. PL002 TaxID=1897058 RepID=UPI001787A818|nr:hypothetical protein [Flavobacterium sp. PL002]MBE0390390.1 hypothetical protein [Flavobacterium sp. PL002]
MKKLVLFAALLFGFLSCSSTTEAVTNTQSIEGTWKLVAMSGGITGRTTTPTTNKEIQISKSEVKIYENGTLIVTENYTIETKKSILGGDKQMLVYTSGSPSQSYVLEGNKLLLNDECYDCYQKEYVRK